MSSTLLSASVHCLNCASSLCIQMVYRILFNFHIESCSNSSIFMTCWSFKYSLICIVLIHNFQREYAQSHSHTRQNISGRQVQCLQISLHNDDKEMMLYTNKRSASQNEYDLQAKTHPTFWTHDKLHNNNENKIPVTLECYLFIQKVTECDVTNISGTQPRKNITMGKVDSSDLMMIITLAINLSFQSPKLKRASLTHTTPYIVMTMKGNRYD